MADSTLDDFFAKKDKSKKGKSKSKFTTTETIAKKLEKEGKKPDILPRRDTKEKMSFSSNNQSIIIPSISNEQEDDEWKNIEEEEKDYSGLRIQALSISEKEKEEEQLKEQMLQEQNGESQRMSDGQSGPWKVMQIPVAEVEEEEEHVASCSDELQLEVIELQANNHLRDKEGMVHIYHFLPKESFLTVSRTATAGSDVVQSGHPIFDDFFQHLWPYIGNNTANVVFQMVEHLWLMRIDL
ncbi:protein CDV3-like protein [Trichonephila clavipes]|uniref:Protein CDV3-like protein n=1 Tax=Trichonephila clavipes TaxID=2585209 RepID=A0A8X6V9U5_TRICX|nr:protein CDV3-like protein [Trichonephila clavipes]